MIIYTATDASGNSSTCSFTVTITDTKKPEIKCPKNIKGCSGAVISYATPVGSDDCSTPTVVRTTGYPSGSNFPAGVTIVTFVATDAAGNTASCSFKVTISDPDASFTVNGMTLTTYSYSDSYQWYMCGSAGLTPIIGAVNQSFTASSSGLYALVVTLNGCKDTSDCIAISTGSAFAESNYQFNVYPVPAKTHVVLELSADALVEIYTATGQLQGSELLESGKHMKSIENFPDGTYFVKFITEGKTVMKRLVVVH